MRTTATLLLLTPLLVPAPGQAERLRYRYRPGQTLQYRAKLEGTTKVGTADGQLLQTQFRMLVRQLQRVRSVRGGTVTLDIEEATLAGKLTTGNKTEALTQPPDHYVVRLTEHGRFLDRTRSTAAREGSAPGIDATDVLFGLNFPDRNLKPGDTWQHTFTVGDQSRKQEVRATWKYAGSQVFRGRKCARIITTLATPLTRRETAIGPAEGFAEQGRMTATLTSYFDPRLGIEIYASGWLRRESKADLSSLNPDAGELANVTRINLVQWYVPPRPQKKPATGHR